jgi:hypothetical protein
LDKPQGQTSRCRRGGATGEEDSARDMKSFVHIFERLNDCDYINW